MDKTNIGFIGGCINNQGGIARDELYYSIVKKLLEQNQPGIGFQITLGSYPSFDQLVSETRDFISRKKPDVLFLFIRPYPLLPLHKPFLKFAKVNNRKTGSLHPALFRRQLAWKNQFGKINPNSELIYAPPHSSRLSDANLLAGFILGLHHWAGRYVVCQIELVRQLCRQNNIRLKVISPPHCPQSAIANMACKRLSDGIRIYCRNQKLEFLNILTFQEENFEMDKLHFNMHGHKKLGRLLYSNLMSSFDQTELRV